MIASVELVASFRSRGSYAHSARGTPAPTYPRGTSEQCVAPVCGSGDGHRRGYSMLCLYAPGAMTSCAAYEVQLLNPCSLTITRGWRDFQNSQPVHLNIHTYSVQRVHRCASLKHTAGSSRWLVLVGWLGCGLASLGYKKAWNADMSYMYRECYAGEQARGQENRCLQKAEPWTRLPQI